MANAIQPKLVEKPTLFDDETMVDSYWLCGHGGALCCGGVRSAAGSSFRCTSALYPEFTYASIDSSNRELANTSGY
ncbi:MAG TPA: hypothetical protein VE054_15385, partial [Blattabacteriaceae bacterium]|nr:hypothetical protein [Blattabacteriaceae bacterium]